MSSRSVKILCVWNVKKNIYRSPKISTITIQKGLSWWYGDTFSSHNLINLLWKLSSYNCVQCSADSGLCFVRFCCSHQNMSWSCNTPSRWRPLSSLGGAGWGAAGHRDCDLWWAHVTFRSENWEMTANIYWIQFSLGNPRQCICKICRVIIDADELWTVVVMIWSLNTNKYFLEY